MRVLLDECVPRKLKRVLGDHEVVTVTENGWSGLKNGELLKLAQAESTSSLPWIRILVFNRILSGSILELS